MIGSVLIIVFSVALFLYWFRYTCLLILSAKTSRDYARQVAEANQLSFPKVQGRLPVATAGEELDGLAASLQRDYRLLTGLLRHAADFNAAGGALEQRMLMIDFRIMRMWYSATRRISSEHARQALEEMSEIVGHFANSMGERQGAGSQA